MIETTEQTAGRPDTKERILDAAERLFAEHGFQGASLRQITAEAQVNLAAVNYHFHSKEALLTAVIQRRMEPVNVERLARLDELEKAAGDAPIPLEALVRALLEPMFRQAETVGPLARLMGRIFSDPEASTRQLMFPAIKQTVERFRPVFLRALPGDHDGKIFLGIFFGFGAAAHYMLAGNLLNLIAPGEGPFQNPGWVVDNLVQYVCAGLRALTKQEVRQ